MSGTPEQGSALTVASDPTNATINQLIQVLQRRKLLWEFKTGIVVPGGSAAGQVIITVQLDGDDNPLPCKTLIGPVLTGTRVAVIFVPPTGYYVIGIVGGQSLGPLGIVGGVNVTTLGGLTVASAAETDITQLQFSATVNTARLYEYRTQVFFVATVATDVVEIKMRRDTALTGTQLGDGTAGGVVNGPTASLSWFFVPTANETIHFFTSHVRRNGTGTFAAQGSPNVGIARTYAALYDVGPAGVIGSA